MGKRKERNRTADQGAKKKLVPLTFWPGPSKASTTKTSCITKYQRSSDKTRGKTYVPFFVLSGDGNSQAPERAQYPPKVKVKPVVFGGEVQRMAARVDRPHRLRRHGQRKGGRWHAAKRCRHHARVERRRERRRAAHRVAWVTTRRR